MATKKTDKSAKAEKAKPVKTAKAPKAAKSASPAAKLPRHPKARVDAAHGSKDALAKSLAESLARDDQDTDQLAGQLKKASNQQLLRLSRVVTTVKEKFGSREKLIASLGTAGKKSTDKDYLAKLETLPLPQLLDLATSAAKHA